MSVGNLYVFFGKMPIQVLSPFFYLVVWIFDIDLYDLFCCVLDINLQDISFANIFLHSVGYFSFLLLLLLLVSITVQKLLHLTRSHLFIFAFVPLT